MSSKWGTGSDESRRVVLLVRELSRDMEPTLVLYICSASNTSSPIALKSG